MLIVLKSIIWTLRFLFGASIYSFLNVVVDRLPRGEGVVKGHSHCDSCGKELTPAELMPIVSYLVLGGKCKNCKSKIPMRGFWGEVSGGATFVLCSAFFEYQDAQIISLRGLLVFAVISTLYVVALIDWDTRIIYDRFHVILLILSGFHMWLFPEVGMLSRLIGLLAISVPMFLLALVIDGAFGGGDIKLMAVCGLLLGVKAVCVATFVGFLTGGLYAMVMLATGKLQRKDHFAFGPFLAAGIIVALFVGETAANWYLQLL